MLESFAWLQALILNYPAGQYAAILLGAAFGGEAAMIALSFLAAQKIIFLWPFIFLSILGAFAGDTLWFFLGRTEIARKIINHRYTSGAILAITEALNRLSRGNHTLAFIIAKFVVGTRAVIIFYVSRSGLKFMHFMKHNTPAIFIWLIAVSAIGYLSGLGFTYFSKILENIYAGVGFVLLVLVILFIVQRRLEKALVKEEDKILGDKDMI